ncbi:MAG: hypothetical protein AB7D37_10690 [Desulfovibrio sp.]
MSKIFARQRRKVEQGEKRPRYRVVAATGDLKFFAEHIRQRELEAIAQSVGAEIIYLPTDASGAGGHKHA